MVMPILVPELSAPTLTNVRMPRPATASAKQELPLSKLRRVRKHANSDRAVKTATARERAMVRVLRKLGTGPLSRKQAEMAGALLGIHWSTVYRLRRRFLANPLASALIPHNRGPKMGSQRLAAKVEKIVSEVITDWLPRQPRFAHPLFELVVEMRKRCVGASVNPPSRSTISRRWAAHRLAEAARLRRHVIDSTTGGIDCGLADPCVGTV